MSIWNNAAAVDLLKTYVEMRIPYPDIASRLKTTTGAVCAKVSRLGIGLGPKTQQVTYRKREAPEFEVTDPAYLEISRELKHEARIRAGTTVHLDEAGDHQCTYVIGEPKHRQVCGDQRKGAGPYCAAHAKRCRGTPAPDRTPKTPESYYRQVRSAKRIPLWPQMKPPVRLVDILPLDVLTLDLGELEPNGKIADHCFA